MDASLMARMKELEEENRRLRKMYVEAKIKAEKGNMPAGDWFGQFLDFKKKEAEATAQRRSEVVLGPIMQDIGRALQTYATSKGYTVVFDFDKIGQGILAFDPKADITAEFIAYYNTRPATAATAAAPR